MQGMGGGNFEPPRPPFSHYVSAFFFIFNCGLILKEVIRHKVSEKDL